MTTATELVRANRVSVQADEQAGFVAKFHRTHKLVATIRSVETAYLETPGMNKTANRELFRIWVCDNASQYGINWDPADRRAETSTMPAKYPNEAVLCSASKILLTPDIDGWLSKINESLPDATELTLISVECDEVTPVESHKGRTVSPRYNNGNWAYATVRIMATVEINDETKSQGYVTMDCSLVSGQLKKPSSIGGLGYTYTGFRTDLGRDFPVLVVKPEPKPEPAKKDTESVGQMPTTTDKVVIDGELVSKDDVAKAMVAKSEAEPKGDTPEKTTGRVGRKLGAQ